MHTARLFFIVLSGCLLFSLPAWAEAPIKMAKVYRDYPGYINPAVCENPNLDKSSTPAPGAAAPRLTLPPPGPAPAPPTDGSGLQKPAGGDTNAAAVAKPPECQAVPYGVRGDNFVGTYLAAWAGIAATQDADIEKGAASAEVTFDPGYGAGVAVGYDFGPGRVELEGSYRNNDIDEVEFDDFSADADGELEIRTLFANAYADLATGGMATPYFGAGVGYAEVELEDHDDGVLAGQLAAGVMVAISPSFAIDLGYRFMMTEDPELDGVDLEVRQHTAMVGLQIRF